MLEFLIFLAERAVRLTGWLFYILCLTFLLRMLVPFGIGLIFVGVPAFAGVLWSDVGTVIALVAATLVAVLLAWCYGRSNEDGPVRRGRDVVRGERTIDRINIKNRQRNAGSTRPTRIQRS